MRSPKSRHQGRYQWSEVQSFARELADRQSEGDQESREAEGKETYRSRIVREGSLREKHEGSLSSSYQRGEGKEPQKIDLKGLRASWQRAQQSREHELMEKKEPSESAVVQHRWDLESGELISEAISSASEEVSRPCFGKEFSQDVGVQEPQVSTQKQEKKAQSLVNPWEQLRDHFIKLRELRLRKEMSTVSHDDPRET